MYEYKVVPAPVRATKVKGLKTTAERFSHALAERINAEAAGGWQFQRSETLPCEERSGLGRTRSTTQTVLIFARPLGALRPDAGGAVAAAQDAQARLREEATAGRSAQDAAPRHQPNGAFPDDRSDRSGHGRQPEAADPAEVPDPVPAEAPQPRRGRQEPLFRSNPMMRPEARSEARPEPVLRPRAAPRDDDHEG